MHETSAAAPVADGEGSSAFWTPLLHRWFVEYNPFYLLSATLVLAGTIVWSHGFSQSESIHSSFGVAAVAELYAAALIGRAALLMRIGQRRPAVMLAFLTALYQGDLTLHTETCAYLGKVGALAAGIWLLVFFGKLYALAWAMRVRPSFASLATAILGALGLSVIPRVLPLLGSNTGSALIAFWLYGLLSLHAFQEVTCEAPLDAWGTVVFRRAVCAIWTLWLVLILGHVYFWSTERSLHMGPFFAAAALYAMRRIHRESRIWLLVASVLALTAWLLPTTFSLTAFFTALALGIRAWPKLESMHAAAEPSVSPYRAAEASPPLRPSVPTFIPLGNAARKRLLVGSMGTLYLAAWTIGWRGGHWPAHGIALDLVMSIGMLLLIWRARVRTALLPPLACVAHGVIIGGLVPMPHSLVAWGSSMVTVGFVVLFASLGINYWLRNAVPRRTAASRLSVP